MGTVGSTFALTFVCGGRSYTEAQPGSLLPPVGPLNNCTILRVAWPYSAAFRL